MRSFRFFIVIGLLLLAGSQLQAQITWNLTYADVTQNKTTGFNDTTYGSTRRSTVSSVTTYINSILDARGTIRLDIQVSDTSSAGTTTLASAGSYHITTYSLTSGSTTTNYTNKGFSSGEVYRQAVSGESNLGSTANVGQAKFNFGFTWNNGTGTPSSGEYDLYSVTLHEFTHALGFSSLIRSSDGRGLISSIAAGSQNVYGTYAQYITKGSSSGATQLFTADGRYIGSSADLTSGDLYFQGEFAREANGGSAVKLYAPSTYEQGSSVSHVDATASGMSNAVMQYNIGTGTERRTYTKQEIAMLLDMGWNTYTWKGSTGNFADNAASSTNSKWMSAEGNNDYTNLTGRDSLSPVGTITPNLILKFNGSGSTAYTATNDLGASNSNTIKINRIVLQSTASVTNTITGNKFEFDTTIDVKPAIRQDRSGAFKIQNDIVMKSSLGLDLRGNGTGQVELSGVISNLAGAGGLSKSGKSTFVLSGTNTYTTGTTVNAGKLIGQLGSASTDNTPFGGNGSTTTGGGNVRVNGGTLRINGNNSVDQTVYGNTLTIGGGANLEVNQATSGRVTTYNFSSLSRVDNGTLIVNGASGSLNSREKVLFDTAPTTISTSNGNVLPFYIVKQTSDSNTTGDYTIYSSGVAGASYSSQTNINSAGNTDIFNATASTTNALTADRTVLALRNNNLTISGSSTLTVGNGTNAGVILNGGSITTTNLNFGTAEGLIYTSSANASISSVIQGSGGITTFGPGTLTLSGTNSYTGTTNANSGTLLVNGSTGSGSSVKVNSMATLGGTGTINGTVTVKSAGTITAGTSTGSGQLTVANNLTFEDGSNYTWNLTSITSQIAGTNYDQISLTGGSLDIQYGATLTLAFASGSSTPNATDNFWKQNQSWTIISFTGTKNSGKTNFTSITNASDYSQYGTFALSFGTDNVIVLTFTPVPEPRYILLIAVCVAIIAVRIRKWRCQHAMPRSV